MVVWQIESGRLRQSTRPSVSRICLVLISPLSLLLIADLITAAWSPLQTRQSIKRSNPDYKPHPPRNRPSNPSNGQNFTVNPDGYSNQGFFGCWGKGRQEGGGRTMLAGHHIVWPNGVTDGGPGPNPGVNLRLELTAISTFGQRIRMHLWEDSEKYAKWAKNMLKMRTICQ